MLLFFLLLPTYNLPCLVKRSRAMRGRNPTRNSQVRTGKWPEALATLCRQGSFCFTPFICSAIPHKIHSCTTVKLTDFHP